MAFPRDIDALKYDARRLVTAHGIQRDRDRLRQTEPLRDLSRVTSFGDFLAIVETASTTHMVGSLQLATILAFRGTLGHQRIMRTTHVATGSGYFTLGNSHD